MDANRLIKREHEALQKYLSSSRCSVEVDNTGQIVLYTGLMFDENSNVVPWVEKEES